ncbi:hypothetical protein K438DRAFT_1772685 [Mycena galopus ATCC 62051]|nr:hypothetical protein K438DRAFT_1772685 [Mycena galopus ATCC 62051]
MADEINPGKVIDPACMRVLRQTVHLDWLSARGIASYWRTGKKVEETGDLAPGGPAASVPPARASRCQLKNILLMYTKYEEMRRWRQRRMKDGGGGTCLQASNSQMRPGLITGDGLWIQPTPTTLLPQYFQYPAACEMKCVHESRWLETMCVGDACAGRAAIVELKGIMGSNLVSSWIQWWVEINKWVSDTRAAEFEDKDTEEEEEPTLIPNPTCAPPKIKNWTKTTLALLFGGVVKKPIVNLMKVDINCEVELMEDVQLDYGAMESLGDKYEP